MTTPVIYIPFTPAGTCLIHLQATTEARAWKNLLHETARMPYRNVDELKARGYTVERFGGAEL